MNSSRSGLLKSGGSVSVNGLAIDLPNLPGVRRDVSLINPKLYKEFKNSQSRGNLVDEEIPFEDNSLMSYFDDSSKFELSRVTTPFPSDGNAYNDISGRYSIISQRKDRMNKTRTLPYSSTDSLPPFVTNASKVLGFVAHFTEPATEVAEERSRKVNIKLYLEDNSMEIVEPKVENSGTTQGKFLKRHQVYKPMARLSDQKELYTIADMKSGAQLDIYNRIYTIVDCDRATYNYMESTDTPFGDPMPLPSNIYDPKTRSGMSRPATRSGLDSRSKKGLGFFEYDRKVLRFFGLWDSRAKLFGDAIQVKVHYYLADDKIEIVSVHERNNGRDHVPTLLKKSLLMKKPSSASQSSFYPERSSSSPTVRDDIERPYHWSDLSIGENIYVASLNVLLIDADEFTREFYDSKNMSLGAPIPMEEPIYPTVINEIPPYNGFGSEEDSLQTCKNSLIPGAPTKNGLKAKTFQGMILRYAAISNNPKEADKSRQFIIQVHLEDDTFQIREPPVRNSGHKGGIFLARCKLESHHGMTPLQPQDLHVGATVTILSHKFDILDCDQYTFKYMEANSHQWKYSSLKEVEARLLPKREVIQRLILTLPGLASRNMDAKELYEILQRSGCDVVLQEAFTVFRAVDSYRTGSIKATKMLKFFIDLR